MENILKLHHITKGFPGVLALDDVTVDIRAGEVHCVAGQNGAGKSTLMKILSGAYQADSGEIVYRGEPVQILNPHMGLKMGITVIYQELDLVPELSAIENIWLGRYPLLRGGLIDWAKASRTSREILGRLGCGFDPKRPVGSLSPGSQQMVAIAKSISHNAAVLVMDEPTSSLSEHEQVQLFRTIGDLKKNGTTILYITHKLHEIFELCDRVTVLRDGRHVGTWEVSQVNQDFLVEQMIGHRIEKHVSDKKKMETEEILRVEGISTPGLLRDVSFSLHKGEILGFAGLVGSGRTELMRLMFGADRLHEGTLWLEGRSVQPRHPRHARDLGLALVPKNRKTEGLVLSLSVLQNILLPSLGRLHKAGFVRSSLAGRRAQAEAARLNTKVSSFANEVSTLSGGNQQKVVLAKWLLAGARILLLDEPTRGIDVGAKEEIYRIMRELAAEGRGIIMISSEFPELLTACDRILVMRAGRIVGDFDAKHTTKEELMATAIVGEHEQPDQRGEEIT